MQDIAQFDKLKQKPLVLFSPLDWGYGHTTRSIPLINTLLDLNCSVTIACNCWQRDLLRPLFPQCAFVDLPGYEIKYSRSASGTRISLLLQIPRILKQIRKENQWLLKLLESSPIQGIVSDNRYGLHQRNLPTVLITHQLWIQSGWGRLTDNLLQSLHYRLISRFNQCWVPDQPPLPGAAGRLSHPSKLPGIPISYLGCLSRFERCTSEHHRPYLLIVLSGPEPSRSILEEMLLKQLADIHEPVVLVRGSQVEPGFINRTELLTIHNYAGPQELNELACGARLVIARSGYTTVMDLLKLKKRSILIPTPGQTEQEYLGRHLMKQQWVLTFPQKGFSLRNALKEAETFPYQTVDWDMESYKGVVEEWVLSLGSGV